MTKVHFIGDVHGKIDEYLKLIADCEQSVQVGDFGAGFVDFFVEGSLPEEMDYESLIGRIVEVEYTHSFVSIASGVRVVD